MRMMLVIVVLAVFSATASLLTQGPTLLTFNHREDVFVNTDCRKNKTCDLKQVEYFVEDYRVRTDGGYNYGTRFFARLETKSVRDLEKYVFVQFIKGCDFSTSLADGEIETTYDRVYTRDDGPIKFRFGDWTIDSYDFDPVYSTIPGKSRFFGYRWNTVPGSFSTDTEKLYGQKKPRTPQVYIVDHPGSAFYSDEGAHNISLEFRTCIYRTKDVPQKVTHDDIDFAEPISCYNWNSSFIYDHTIQEFRSYSDISPACE